jgi:hypothetical protein
MPSRASLKPITVERKGPTLAPLELIAMRFQNSTSALAFDALALAIAAGESRPR